MGKKHKKQKSERHHTECSSSDKTPLKMVFKLGTEGTYDSDYANPISPYSSESSHKKKKKKHYKIENPSDRHTSHSKKRRSSNDLNESELHSSSSDAFCHITSTATDPESPTMLHPLPVDPVAHRGATSEDLLRKNITTAKQSALNKLLDNLMKQLERKDPHEIFAWPVNDLIAPGYSTVIDEPMDFSTMKNKMLLNQYDSVKDFRRDFETMVDNCCIYNKPDTVYYDSAKKMKSTGLKIMSKERLNIMKRTLPFLHDLSKLDVNEIMGLSTVEDAVVSVDMDFIENNALCTVGDSEAENVKSVFSSDIDLRAHKDAISFTDADYEDSVATDAIHEAEVVHSKVTHKQPKTKFSFLETDESGGTYLNILNPDVNEKTRINADIGSLLNPVSSGIDTMPELKEDKRNKLTPIEYLSYGPFGSFAPSYDSRLANITQQESDLLLSAYGGDTGYLFAQSMQDFVSGANDRLKSMVGDLLDNVTHGAHGQAVEDISKSRKKLSAQGSNSKIKIDFHALKSLDELGIDVSFVDHIRARVEKQSGEWCDFFVKSDGHLIIIS